MSSQFSLVNIELDREQIATKGFIAFLCSTMHIKQHTKSLPKLKNHKGSNYDAEENNRPSQNVAA